MRRCGERFGDDFLRQKRCTVRLFEEVADAEQHDRGQARHGPSADDTAACGMGRPALGQGLFHQVSCERGDEWVIAAKVFGTLRRRRDETDAAIGRF